MPAAAIDPFTPKFYRVREVRRELSDTVTLDIVPPDGSRPACAPGQFNMLYVFGVGEIAISMSGDCTDESRFVHTVRDVGAVSKAITALEAGAMIGVRGPFGTGWPVAEAEGSDVVIVAGGLGLAPLRPAIYHVLANRARYGRVAVLFGTSNPEDMLFRDELAEWRQNLDIGFGVRRQLRGIAEFAQHLHGDPRMSVEVTVDHADTGWRGNVGVVPDLIPRAPFQPHDTVAFVCGPEVMMRYTAAALIDAGVAAERIHLSMERNMKCAIGLCGHCQFGPSFICKDGPVMRFDKIARILAVREI
jgi:NAD(P)H-flavin reductase